MVFRQIAIGDESARAERLVRAAVAAFCSLTRPTRLEIHQLDRLVHPLFDRVPTETRRYVAAALSDSPHAPAELVRRLAAEQPDVAAPLLMRSPVLKDVDLVGLIARCGIEHARIIARRRDINPAIARLIVALSAATSTALATDGAEAPGPAAIEAAQDQAAQDKAAPDQAAREEAPADATDVPPPAEETRRALRAMMGGQTVTLPAHRSFVDAYRSARSTHALYERFRATLLARDGAGFRGTIAAATGLDARSARSIAEARDYDDLMAVLRHIGLDEEQAFLLVCAAAPGRFATTEAIRAFLEAFRRLERGAASRRVAEIRAEAERRAPRLVETAPVSAGGDALRAS